MWELLQELEDLGWKPYGKSIAELTETEKNVRLLTSLSSGLWQFVCENELYPPYIQHRWFRDLPTNGLQIHDYRYWVIESALQDESELESFILDNIKVDEKDNM